MSPDSLLKDKAVLIVDDEPDILEGLVDLLDMCRISTAQDYDTAVQLLASYTFDIVILDIMGVDGFKLLDIAKERNVLPLFCSPYES